MERDSAVQAAAPEPLTIFCLHYLGGSGREFETMARRAGGASHFQPIDLPGFGDAHRTAGFSVAEMARDVADTIRRAGASRWSLLGHSMGAKVAAVIAAHIEHGELSLSGLKSLILLAGSPPAPEPMDDDKRQTMLSWFHGDESTTRAEQQGYIEQNVTRSLPPLQQEQALRDLRRMNRAAWVAWLESGSREDWSDRVGVLKTPTLLVAGDDDEALGLSAQTTLMAPHFPDSRIEVIEGASHLLPMEAAAELERLIADHARSLA